MKRNLILFFCFLISFSCQDKITAIPKDPQPPLTGILSTLKKEHPRLMLTNSLVEGNVVAIPPATVTTSTPIYKGKSNE